MEAKDIVAKEVARQAEFGMEPSFEDIAIAAYEDGMKEVVEFVDKTLKQFKGEQYLDEDKWQAFLKSHGLEK